MKFPWSGGGDDAPKTDPEAGLPKVDPRYVAKQQKEADEAKQRAETREARKNPETPGPAARLAKDYPADALRTEGPKPGTDPAQGVEKKPTQLKNDPGPQAAPDVAKPGVIYTMQPGGGMKATQAPQPPAKSWEERNAPPAPPKPDQPGDDTTKRSR